MKQKTFKEFLKESTSKPKSKAQEFAEKVMREHKELMDKLAQ